MNMRNSVPDDRAAAAGASWRYAPAVVAILGLLLSALLYWLLVRNEQRHREQVVAVQIAALEETLKAGLEQRSKVLARTARRWELSGGREPQEFDLEAAVNIESYPAFRALGWVDPDLTVRWVYPRSGNEAVVGFENRREPHRRSTLLSARQRGQLAVLGPVNLVQGGRSLLFFQPIRPVNRREQGFIYAAVDPERLVQQIIGRVAAGYGLAISVNGETVYRRLGAASAKGDPAATAMFNHGGVPWRLAIWTLPIRPGLAELAGAAAALISLGLATGIWLSLRAQARQSLLRREVRTGQERFRAVFDNAAIGMARVGFDGAKFLEVNDALCGILGYSREELLVTPWTAITHPDDLDLDLEPFKRMAAGELDSYVVEKRFVHAAGHHVWTRLALSLVRSGDGTPDFEICIVEDISAQKAAATEVRGARDLLQSIIDGALDPIFVKDREGRFVFANARLAELFGKPRNMIVGRTDADFWPPDFVKHVQEMDQAVIRSGAPRIVEEELPGKDGPRVFQSQLVPWRDPSGNVIGVVGVGRDITALKQQGEALAASEQRLNVAAETAGFGSYEWDIVHDRHVWSAQTYEIFGVPREAPLTFSTVMERIVPEERTCVEQELSRFFAEGADIANEYRIARPDGSIRYIINRARVTYEEDGEGRRPVRMIGAVRDATDQRLAELAVRESEERYRTLIDSIEAGFSMIELIFDGEGRPADYRFIEVNPAFVRQTGLEHAVGKTVRELLPALEQHWFDIYGRVAQTGEPTRFENGSESMGRWFDVYAVPVGTRAPYRVGILFNDITDRRQAELEVIRLNQGLEQLVEERTRRLEETVAELDAFAYTISHDLRAPLRGIEGFARILNEEHAGELGSAGQRYAQRIYAAAERMDQLIQDLLAYSRLSRADLELKLVDLDAVVAATIGDHQAVIAAAGAKVAIERPLPAICGNRAAVSQIVANLLTNAIKFVAEGTTPEIRIHAEERGSMVRLSVEDNGIGIAEEYRDRIFNVFERLHGQEHYAGTGIGLAIVRKAAERMGGVAGVEAGAGGSRFWVDLPAAKRQERA